MASGSLSSADRPELRPLAQAVGSRHKPLVRASTPPAAVGGIGALGERLLHFSSQAGLSLSNRTEWIARAGDRLVRPPDEFFSWPDDEPVQAAPEPVAPAVTGDARLDHLIHMMRRGPASRPPKRSPQRRRVKRGLPSSMHRRGWTRAGTQTAPGGMAQRLSPVPAAPHPNEANRYVVGPLGAEAPPPPSASPTAAGRAGRAGHASGSAGLPFAMIHGTAAPVDPSMPGVGAPVSVPGAGSLPGVPGGLPVPGAPPVPGVQRVPSLPGVSVPGAPPVPGVLGGPARSVSGVPGGVSVSGAPPVPGVSVPGAPPVPGVPASVRGARSVPGVAAPGGASSPVGPAAVERPPPGGGVAGAPRVSGGPGPGAPSSSVAPAEVDASPGGGRVVGAPRVSGGPGPGAPSSSSVGPVPGAPPVAGGLPVPVVPALARAHVAATPLPAGVAPAAPASVAAFGRDRRVGVGLFGGRAVGMPAPAGHTWSVGRARVVPGATLARGAVPAGAGSALAAGATIAYSDAPGRAVAQRSPAPAGVSLAYSDPPGRAVARRSPSPALATTSRGDALAPPATAGRVHSLARGQSSMVSSGAVAAPPPPGGWAAPRAPGRSTADVRATSPSEPQIGAVRAFAAGAPIVGAPALARGGSPWSAWRAATVSPSPVPWWSHSAPQAVVPGMTVGRMARPDWRRPAVAPYPAPLVSPVRGLGGSAEVAAPPQPSRPPQQHTPAPAFWARSHAGGASERAQNPDGSFWARSHAGGASERAQNRGGGGAGASEAAATFSAELERSRSRPRPRPLPPHLLPLASQIVGDAPVGVSTSPASRRALRAVGKPAATTGSVVHLARTPDQSTRTTELVAHELTHVAHPSPVPRFYDDDTPSAEERQAREVAKIMRRRPAGVPLAARTVEPARVATTQGLAVGVAGGFRTGQRQPGAATNPAASASRIQRTSAPTPTTSVTADAVAERITRESSHTNQQVRRLAPPAPTSSPPDLGTAGESSQVLESRSAFDDADEFERLLERLEDRLLVELERRGGRFRGGF